MNTPSCYPKAAPSRAGFTLVELLVVISIILIASAVLFTAGSGGKGAALSSSQRIVAAL
jgi:prepilin-type N-terminal cleavage/methylation domain-containing protein